ncbi:MAG: glycosyltransferase family 4 protein [Acidobacteria bacterium]|nr:glycosyltransferase family 4 protein [Acidobacteriota bacterium]
MTVRVMRIIARLNVGGPAIHATLLSRRLEAEGFDTMLVAGAESREEGSYLELHGGGVRNLQLVSDLGREIHPWRDWLSYRALVRLMREFRPQIVHTHTAKAGMLGRLAAWRCGVPVVVHTFHGHVFRGYFSPAKTAVFVGIERVLARLSTRLLAVSEQVRDEVLACGVGRPSQFEVLRLGLDLDRFARAGQVRGELRRELGIGSDVPLVGIVARLVPIKAHDVFLAVAARVTRVRPDAVFLIVGDGETKAALVEQAEREGLGGAVRFLGWRSDLDRVYADLDVVVLTSRNEGSPVALIEAMASARPVVSTTVGGVPELVGDAGLLCPVDDVDALTASVLRLIASPELAESIGNKGRTRVIPAYSEDRLVADMAALYARLLPGPPEPKG